MRLLRINVLVLMVLLACAQPARADVWDWLEELTAPGPSHSRGNLTATIYCNRNDDVSGWFRPLNGDRQARTCVFADVRRFKSEEDARFFESRIEMYQAGPTFRLIPPLEIGAGVGLMHIDSSGIKVNRMTISFPRIVLKPLLAIPSLEDKGELGFFQMYFSETRIFGEFTEADFNTKPGYTFSSRVNGDVPRSFGFMIDLPLLIRVFKH